MGLNFLQKKAYAVMANKTSFAFCKADGSPLSDGVDDVVANLAKSYVNEKLKMDNLSPVASYGLLGKDGSFAIPLSPGDSSIENAMRFNKHEDGVYFIVEGNSSVRQYLKDSFEKNSEFVVVKSSKVYGY